MINEVKAYQCDKCKKAFFDQDAADGHYCTHDQHCEDCGVLLKPEHYYTVCDSCRAKRESKKEAERFAKARKLTVAEYEKEFPGCLYSDGDDKYAYEADSVADEIAERTDKYPIYVWGTKQEEINLNADSIIQMLEEHDNAYEDYEVSKDAIEEIREFVEQFNEEHADHSFFTNYNVAVLMPEPPQAGE